MGIVKKRRHHNNTGLRGIKTGRVGRDIEHIARRLNVPTDTQIAKEKRQNERKKGYKPFSPKKAGSANQRKP